MGLAYRQYIPILPKERTVVMYKVHRLPKYKAAESMEVIDAICQVCGARSRTRTWFCRQKNPCRMEASKC